jgi:hypothetical protein
MLTDDLAYTPDSLDFQSLSHSSPKRLSGHNTPFILCEGRLRKKGDVCEPLPALR